MSADQIAEQIYRGLSTSVFAHWYGLNDSHPELTTGGRFDVHIQGAEPGEHEPTKEEILEDIKKLFGLN